jgi:serine/threonine-protein kinase HipA
VCSWIGAAGSHSRTMMHGAKRVAFVAERYDRHIGERGILRIHQEDMCQALGCPPTKKYENDGGPGVTRIVDLLRENSSAPRDDVQTFIDAVAFNWLIGGTDAHAKNYSMLIGTAGRVRLAPIYDVASILPYDEYDPMKIRLAMKLGGSYRICDISARSWEKLSAELRLDQEQVARRICAMSAKLPGEAKAIRGRLDAVGMRHPILDRLTERLCHRADQCERLFSGIERATQVGE